jgi:hypothetical protein
MDRRQGVRISGWSRHIGHVPGIGVAELGQRLALLAARKAQVPDDEHRKHDQRQQRRPLQQEAEHDQDEARVLRVANMGIGARCRQRSLPLRLVKHAPSFCDQHKAAADERAANHRRTRRLRPAWTRR